jgi:hypothetical protein
MPRTPREFKIFEPNPNDLRIASGTDWGCAGTTGAFVTAIVSQQAGLNSKLIRPIKIAILGIWRFVHLTIRPSQADGHRESGNHTISLTGGTELPQTPRFNQLWIITFIDETGHGGLRQTTAYRA